MGLLGYGFLRAWVVFYLMISNQPIDGFSQANGIFLVAVCLGASFPMAFRKLHAYRRFEKRCDVFILGAGIVGACCVHFGLLLSNPAYLFAGFSAVGLCGGYFEVKWGEKYLPFSDIQVNCNLLLAFLISAAIGVLSSEVVPGQFAFVESLVLLACMGVCWMALWDAQGQPREDSPSLTDAAVCRKGSDRTLFNVAMTSFLFCFAQMAALGICSATTQTADVYSARFIANFVTVVLLAGVFLLRKNLGFLTLLKALLLVTAVGLFLQVLDRSAFGMIPVLILLVGNKLFDVFILLLLVKFCQRGIVAGGIGFGVFVISKNAGVLVGKMAGSTVVAAIGSDPASLSLYIGILEIVLLVSFFWMFSFKQIGAAVPHAAPVDLNERLNEHVRIVSERFGLTARETEVLELLARGKNRESIAKEQHLSKSTVHTHIIHIYQKTDVHSQQELIALVEEVLPGQ